ncbi:MAG: B3/4 domain-containing protein [Enterococcus sp.]
MKKFQVEETFWELFPQAQIYVLVLNNINNQEKPEKVAYFQELLMNGSKEAQQFIQEEPFTQNAVIAQWREAFMKFKTKKGARSSIEALLKRVSQGREFSPINPLVDLYNSVSLKYALPCGGEDLAEISGDLRLGKAQGGENFLPLGAETDAPALPEEIIYYDHIGAVCRCLNWREAQRTMLTNKTTDAVLVIEAINEEQAQRAQLALNELQQLTQNHFEVVATSHVLTKETPECPLA